MRVGVQMIFQAWGYDGVDDAQVVDEELRLALLADELGFHALWPVEHHFTDYSFCPDNTVLLAHLAARTSQIKLGTGAVILPWNDPLRVAEKIALLDQLAEGRVLFGIGRGLARREYAGFGIASAAADRAGVVSVVVLSWRYGAAVRAFVEHARGFDALGGRGAFISGGFLGGPFATPWRLERGPLLDLGPHVLDLLDASLGPITGVQAHGDLRGWVGLLTEHEGGRVGEVSLCATAKLEPHRAGVELYGNAGVVEIDCVSAVGPEAFATLRAELARAVRTDERHPLDVHRGLHLQRLLTEAEAQLRSRS